jgi:hypothetical protein
MPWLQQWLFVFCQNMYCGLLMWERHTSLCTHQFPAQHSVLPKLSAKLLFDVVMQQHLMNMVHNAQVDDILLILAVADAHSALHLHSMCLQVIAHSELSILTLEKELSKSAMEEVVDLRRRLGVPELDMDSQQAKQCKRIYRALDLDDVELVQMLLKEERTTLNYTYGLHYAAMYCDPKIMVDLLKLEIAGDLGDMWLAHLSRYWFFH